MIVFAFFIVLTALAIEDWRRLSVPLPLVGLAWVCAVAQVGLTADWEMGYLLAAGVLIPVLGALVQRHRQDRRPWIGVGDLWVLPPLLAFFPVEFVSVFLVLSGVLGLITGQFYRQRDKVGPEGAFPLMPAFWLAWLLTMVMRLWVDA